MPHVECISQIVHSVCLVSIHIDQHSSISCYIQWPGLHTRYQWWKLLGISTQDSGCRFILFILPPRCEFGLIICAFNRWEPGLLQLKEEFLPRWNATRSTH
eukprot:m.427548 g.427548  ORF g.427548 m.427548 type:complete len:101 (+) comp21363_c1_seq3:409-711(+)